MSKNPFLARRSLLSMSVTTALSAMVLGGMAPGALAQEDESLEEVVITGSRIVRRDFESNSPIVTVDAGDFEQQAGLNIESFLNQLPTYNPAASPVTTQGDVQITPVNSVGIASISLRGFGPNRSLVLVNGKRPTPINALMVTDVNGVPSALVQRVETITGGASAVYGADAIGGVTNFILRNNFEGFEVDGQYGVTDAGDGDEYRTSVVLGANFADGRGNVVLGLEHYNREAGMQRNRDIYKEFWADPYTAGTFGLQGINGYSCASGTLTQNDQTCPSASAVRALYPAGTSPFTWNQVVRPNGSVNTGFNFNPDGTMFTTTAPGGLTRFKTPIDGQEYVKTITLSGQDPAGQALTEGVKWNNQDNFASAPQERYSFFTHGTFNVTDNVTAFARATYAESKTATLLFGTSVISGWETSVPYNPTLDSPVNPALNYKDEATVRAILANPTAYANPTFRPTGSAGANFPVPLEMAVLLNSRATQNARWQPQWNPDNSLPDRQTYNINNVWQIETGLDIELPFRDWTAELYYSHGESSTYNNASGNLSLTRVRALTNYPDYGRGATGTGNAFYTVGTTAANAQVIPTIRPFFGVGDFKCTSGFYDTFFKGDQPLSEDCYNAINAVLQTRASNQQDIIEINLQGSIMELPAGELRVAGGYQMRDNAAQFVPDILQSQDSFQDQVIGVYPTGYLDASTKVDDWYVEALIPVINGITGIQQLELELGARYSDYRETEAQTTWKALANWQINDWARLRGGFNRATRAPNLGELFLNQQEVFTGGGAFSDPCGVRSNSPYGAGGTTFATDPIKTTPTEVPPFLAAGASQASANSAFLICQALMGATATQNYYFAGSDVTQPGGGGGFAWVLQEGNRNLDSETSDSWTFGGVLRAPSSNPWLSGLNFTLDWYKVEIEDAIMQYSLDFAQFRCFGTRVVTTPAEAQEQARTDGCQLMPRDQNNGAALSTKISYDNQATIETSGFDIGANWFANFNDLGFDLPGGLGVSVNATVLDYYRTKQSPGVFDPEIEWAGSLGPNLSGTQGGAYDFRLFGNLSYIKDDWSVTLRWRHLPEVDSVGMANTRARMRNNEAVTAGAPGIILNYSPITEQPIDAYNIFDLAANWTFSETLAFRAGITNLLDVEPETQFNPGRPVGTPLSSYCQGQAPGCLAPFSYSVPSRGGFNGGYYDTIGRRMFIGVKASF
jgi:iron complex outermembrane receptor protein